MRHLHFTQSLEPLQGGGLGRAALELHQALETLGDKSHLVATRDAGFKQVWCGVDQFPRAGPAKAFLAPQVAEAASELVREADVVHGHGFYVGTNYFFGRAARLQRKCLVYHAHGFFEPWILSRSRLKKRVVNWLFEDANFRHARLWRALTAKEADQVRAQGVNATIVVAPNGIDLTAFPNQRSGPGSNQTRRRLLFLGRIHPKKGLDLLINVWATLTSERRDWELLLAGPDEDGHLVRMENLTRQLAVADSVRFIGTVTGPAKIELLATADLFVLPSYSEGFSMAILEAMAARTPVIATDACNFPELHRADAGWECRAEAESLRRALRVAMSVSDEERRQRGERGRRLVEQAYTWPVIARRISDACASVLGSNS